jgi:hypothetical protein
MSDKKNAAFKAETMRTEYYIELNDILDVITLGEIDRCLDELGNEGIDGMIDGIDGVDEIEYNGHFGNCIYFRVSKEFDTRTTHKAIEKVLKDSMSRIIVNSDYTKEIVLECNIDLLGGIEDSIESYVSERNRELQWIDEDTSTFAISEIGGCCHNEFKFRLSHNNKLEIYKSLS